LAGPKRPQDRVNLGDVQVAFQKALGQTKNEGGFGIDLAESRRNVDAVVAGQPVSLKHGALVIASITSCTNTSNPYVLIAAGLMARKAVEKGLKISPTVKTSFSPGSRVVTAYLEDAGLMEALDKLGFNLTGYGCMTCIGNSGPLADGMAEAIKNGSLVAASVLSGNRNFEGRVHPLAQANYLASPPLVVVYALAGTVDINLTADPLGVDRDGQPVYLKDLWPTRAEILEVVELVVKPELFREKYSNISQGSQEWNQIDIQGSVLFDWDKRSTYLQEPPFYSGLDKPLDGLTTIHGLRALAVFGDSVTTDHISPAGSIPEASPAGRYLKELGIALMDFNTYGARRGNDRVMARGTFANIRIKNLLLPGIEGGETLHFPQGERLSIFDAAQKYRQENVPLLIFAGKEYGTGSSRDWAAKGPALLGVRAVIAESFERIHRSNLAGMGILPLQFLPGVNLAALGLTGREEFELASEGELRPDGMMLMTAKDEHGCVTCFRVKVRLNSEREVNILRSGGILQAALREMLH
jgi:aconitate hydratase